MPTSRRRVACLSPRFEELTEQWPRYRVFLPRIQRKEARPLFRVQLTWTNAVRCNHPSDRYQHFSDFSDQAECSGQVVEKAYIPNPSTFKAWSWGCPPCLSANRQRNYAGCRVPKEMLLPEHDGGYLNISKFVV